MTVWIQLEICRGFSEEQMAVIRKLAKQERMLEPVLNPDFSPEQMQLVSDISEKSGMIMADGRRI